MAIALVQSVQASSNGSASVSAAFSPNLTAGNFVWAAQSGYVGNTGESLDSVTDTLGLTYHQGSNSSYIFDSGIANSEHGRAQYAYNIAGGANTVTGHLSASDVANAITLVISEWSGVQTTADPLLGDNNTTTSSPSTTPISGNVGGVGSFAVGSLVLALCTTTDPTGSFTEDPVYTNLQKNNGVVGNQTGTEYHLITAGEPNPVDATYTIGTSSNWGMLADVFASAVVLKRFLLTPQ